MSAVLHAHPNAVSERAPSTSAALPAWSAAPSGAFASRTTAVAWGALHIAVLLSVFASVGPYESHLLVFGIGASVLVTALTCVYPFLGAMLVAAVGTALWTFVDAEPANVLLASASFVTAAFALRHWFLAASRRAS